MIRIGIVSARAIQNLVKNEDVLWPACLSNSSSFFGRTACPQSRQSRDKGHAAERATAGSGPSYLRMHGASVGDLFSRVPLGHHMIPLAWRTALMMVMLHIPVLQGPTEPRAEPNAPSGGVPGLTWVHLPVLHLKTPLPDGVDRRVDQQLQDEGCEDAADHRGRDALHHVRAGAQ